MLNTRTIRAQDLQGEWEKKGKKWISSGAIYYIQNEAYIVLLKNGVVSQIRKKRLVAGPY